MGASGSGKSTLMHLLAGLDRPTSGTVVIDGQQLGGLDDKGLTRLRRDRLGFVFQAFNLVPVLTAEENVLLPLSIAGRRPDPEWFDRLIDTVGLGDRLTHRPAEALSSPAAQCMRVDFPEPDLPMIAVNSPAYRSRVTSSSATTRVSPDP